jgi:hypothetical protein
MGKMGRCQVSGLRFVEIGGRQALRLSSERFYLVWFAER